MSDPRYARSFDSVAEQYERARPEYASEAVDWLVGRLGLGPESRVLDLAAGTGKLTRQLVRRGLDVVAVEPGDEMRAVLERVLPQVEALAGTAEEIPLDDASVDAITVGQAFHWFEPQAALAEMARVLRPGGGIALLWNRWDEEDPLLSQIDALLRQIRPTVARRDDFELEYERRTFRQLRAMTVSAIVEWAGSTSGWVNAPPETRRTIEAEIRRLGEGHTGEVSIATDVVVAWGVHGRGLGPRDAPLSYRPVPGTPSRSGDRRAGNRSSQAKPNRDEGYDSVTRYQVPAPGGAGRGG